MDSIFRKIVIASFLFSVASWLIPYFRYFLVQEEDLKFLNLYGYKTMLPLNELLFLGAFAFWALLYLGLFLFNKYAKTGFLVFVGITVIISPFMGWVVYTPIEAMVHHLVNISYGVILMFMYFTSVKEKFNRGG